MQDLGILAPAPNEDNSTSVAYGVNSKSVIVGASGGFEPGPNDGLTFSSAFIFETSMNRLIEFASGSNVSEGQQAFGINDAGVVVGIDGYEGFVYGLSGQKYAIPVTPLSKLGTGNGTVATGVNASNVVVGATTVGSAQSEHTVVHAFLWRHPPLGDLTDLGTIGNLKSSMALGINNEGSVVGYTSLAKDGAAKPSGSRMGSRDPSTLAFDWVPQNGDGFKWRNGTIELLLPLGRPTAAYAINDHDVAVGTSGGRASAWFGDGPTDLNSLLPVGSDWTLQVASGINNLGWIVGWGERLGEQHAFLLYPK
jgi:uncharacterized membrane protein